MKTEKFSIPKGCKKVEIDHENGVVIMHVEEEKVEFKRGDILQSIGTKDRILIYGSKTNVNTFESICGTSIIKSGWLTDRFRHATPEEAKLLFDKLEEEGYKWNAETLELEKIEKFEKGELVLMRTFDTDIWLPKLFLCKNRIDFSYLNSTGMGIGGFSTQCTKFDQKLMGTTNKPKQL